MRRNVLILILLGLVVVAFLVWANPQNRGNELTAQMAQNNYAPVEGFSYADGSRQLYFPKDFGPHPDFQTEWWYYTGNLDDEQGRHFGYELTFFRIGLLPPDQSPVRSSEWATEQFFMAHFALTDVDGDEFHAFQRYERGAGGLAGVAANPYHVRLDDWSVQLEAPNEYRLLAANENLFIDLHLKDDKGPILHGDAGYSRKGPDKNNASYYYSETRLLTNGEIQIGDQFFLVSGLSWKDHEFSTNAMATGQVGWDWFSIQLDDDYEIMLYQIRRDDGSLDSFSSGTLISPDGSTQALALNDFTVETTGSWHSPHSGTDYPMGWRILIQKSGLDLRLSPFLEDQELNLSTIYWEGAVRVSGLHNGREVDGVGYVEMTGYAAPLNPGL